MVRSWLVHAIDQRVDDPTDITPNGFMTASHHNLADDERETRRGTHPICSVHVDLVIEQASHVVVVAVLCRLTQLVLLRGEELHDLRVAVLLSNIVGSVAILRRLTSEEEERRRRVFV